MADKILTVAQLRQLLEHIEPTAHVYMLQGGEYVPLFEETLNIADDEDNIDRDGEAVPVGSVVLV